jgi:hypothetical protein
MKNEKLELVFTKAQWVTAETVQKLFNETSALIAYLGDCTQDDAKEPIKIECSNNKQAAALAKRLTKLENILKHAYREATK